jgi:hypothetical protein
MVMIVITRHMRHGPLVATAEPVPIRIAIIVPHVGVLVTFVIIGVGVAMAFKIMSSGFDAIVKTLPLHIAVVLWGLIPIVILRDRGGSRSAARSSVGLHHGRAHQDQ